MRLEKYINFLNSSVLNLKHALSIYLNELKKPNCLRGSAEYYFQSVN